MLLDLFFQTVQVPIEPMRYGEMPPRLNKMYLGQILKTRQRSEDELLLLLEEV